MYVEDYCAGCLLGQGFLQGDKSLDLGKRSGVSPADLLRKCAPSYTGSSCRNLTGESEKGTQTQRSCALT